MTKRTRLFLAILVIIVLILVGVFAWLFKTGKIKIGASSDAVILTGTVTDANTGAKLAGKKIVLRGYDKFKDASDADYENNALYGNICIGGDSKDIVDQYEAKSDKDGKFTITDKEMLPGKYFIDFCSTGNPNYQEITDRNQTIDLLAGTTEIKVQYPKTVKIEVTADKNGNYNITQAPPGKYAISSTGTDKVGDIEIKNGQKAVFDFVSATNTTTTTKPGPTTTTTTTTPPPAVTKINAKMSCYGGNYKLVGDIQANRKDLEYRYVVEPFNIQTGRWGQSNAISNAGTMANPFDCSGLTVYAQVRIKNSNTMSPVVTAKAEATK